MSTPTQSTATSQHNASLDPEGTDPHGETIITELSPNTKYQVDDKDFVSIIDCADDVLRDGIEYDCSESTVNDLNTSFIKTEIKPASAYKMTEEDRLEASTRHFARWARYMAQQFPAKVDEGSMQEEGAMNE